jgi:enamine deaminase RidA (YjgF/YER057c/UK114 family)
MQNLLSALKELGGEAKDIVRTRVFLTSFSTLDVVGEAHKEYFGACPPASTWVEVSALVRPEYRIEIEAEAVISNSSSPTDSSKLRMVLGSV